jgi:hypothetical protein
MLNPLERLPTKIARENPTTEMAVYRKRRGEILADWRQDESGDVA